MHDAGVGDFVNMGISVFFPERFSLPALRLLSLERIICLREWHLNCPSLETLRIRDVMNMDLPTSLGSCKGLTTLEVVASEEFAGLVPDAGLPVAIKSVQATLEVLNISGWGAPALDGVSQLISRLSRLHTLVAQDEGWADVPALPASLRSLDLRANEFTEIPEQLESLTQLTRLALSSWEYSSNFQIKRPLDPLINMPHLQELTLVLDSDADTPKFNRWGARSLYYLGLAQHEIARSELNLVLKF